MAICGVCSAKQAHYGLAGGAATHCGRCRVPGLIAVYRPRCACGVIARFSSQGIRPATHCGRCHPPDFINIVSKRCACGVQASFGKPGSHKRTHCAKCRPTGFIEIGAIRCACGVRASFGALGGRPVSCVKHKRVTDAYLHGKTCLHANCIRCAVYGYQEDGVVSFCSEHKPEGCVNLKTPTCIAPGCKKAPSFGEEGDNTAILCSRHKNSNHVNVRLVRCHCGTTAIYRHPLSLTREFCAHHAPPNYVNPNVGMLDPSVPSLLQGYSDVVALPTGVGLDRRRNLLVEWKSKRLTLKHLLTAVGDPDPSSGLYTDADRVSLVNDVFSAHLEINKLLPRKERRIDRRKIFRTWPRAQHLLIYRDNLLAKVASGELEAGEFWPALQAGNNDKSEDEGVAHRDKRQRRDA